MTAVCVDAPSGEAPREGMRGTVLPLCTKVVFVNRLKPMRKYWRCGGDVTNHTWISAWVCYK